jgi:hypothetical protein
LRSQRPQRCVRGFGSFVVVLAGAGWEIANGWLPVLEWRSLVRSSLCDDRRSGAGALLTAGDETLHN